MSDTWNDIQAFKSRQNNLRERMLRRKKELGGIVSGINTEITTTNVNNTVTSSTSQLGLNPSNSRSSSPVSLSSTTDLKDNANIEQDKDQLMTQNPEIELKLLQCLCDVALNLPTDSRYLLSLVSKVLGTKIAHLNVEDLLQKFAAQELLTIKEGLNPEGKTCLIINSAEHTKLQAFSNELCPKLSSANALNVANIENASLKRKLDVLEAPEPEQNANINLNAINNTKELIKKQKKVEDTIESLLSLPSAREKENKKVGEEILELLSKPTAKERSLVERFRSQGGAQVQEFCPHGIKEECKRVSELQAPCNKLHFKKIIQKHTDESLGDCSFLNTCFHMDTCKYVHYEVDYSTVAVNSNRNLNNKADTSDLATLSDTPTVLYPTQWIQCDLRFFDMTILGKFAVIMADPPWDIHMELPYGTMSDDEMRQLNVPSLQDEGLIFLWVTGRAMELGRECLRLWGYTRCDEIIWVKTNQLQRIIRTGRTGHWLNHGKEHCLVGAKGNIERFNRGLDCDVIVAEVRATSHKPDEIYGMIERLSPGTRKIELFGRPHNIQPNWMTLGNQLDGVRLHDPALIEAFNQRYPDQNCMKKPD